MYGSAELCDSFLTPVNCKKMNKTVFCPVKSYPKDSPNEGNEYIDTPNGHRIELGHSEALKHDDAYRAKGCSYMRGVGWGMDIEIEIPA